MAPRPDDRTELWHSECAHRGRRSGRLPGGAAAATVSVDAGTLAYSAGQGEINQVRIERVAAFFRVRDDTATLTTADPDCTAITEHLARCLAAPVNAIEALGRDQPDTIIVGGAKPTTISGGDGTDTLQSDQGDDTLSAGLERAGAGVRRVALGGRGRRRPARVDDDRASSTFMQGGAGRRHPGRWAGVDVHDGRCRRRRLPRRRGQLRPGELQRFTRRGLRDDQRHRQRRGAGRERRRPHRRRERQR